MFLEAVLLSAGMGGRSSREKLSQRRAVAAGQAPQVTLTLSSLPLRIARYDVTQALDFPVGRTVPRTRGVRLSLGLVDVLPPEQLGASR